MFRNFCALRIVASNNKSALRYLFQSNFSNSRNRLMSEVAKATESKSLSESKSLPIPSDEKFTFGHLKLPASQLFYLTSLSFATVNLKPVVNGHVLVSPRRLCERVSDLRPDELTDLWVSAQKVGKMLEKQTSAAAFTWAIQDGEAAGQTVKHVHIHILPRRPGDFPDNDDVYRTLEKEKKSSARLHLDDQRTARTAEDMAAEALAYRKAMAEMDASKTAN